MTSNGNKTTAIILVVIVIFAFIIYLLCNGGGGNGNTSPTPTPSTLPTSSPTSPPIEPASVVAVSFESFNIGGMVLDDISLKTSSGVEQIKNGCFETGDFLNWVNPVIWSGTVGGYPHPIYWAAGKITNTAHGGLYGCSLGWSGAILQNFSAPISLTHIQSLTVWTFGDNSMGLVIKLWLSNGTTLSQLFFPNGGYPTLQWSQQSFNFQGSFLENYE